MTNILLSTTKTAIIIVIDMKAAIIIVFDMYFILAKYRLSIDPYLVYVRPYNSISIPTCIINQILYPYNLKLLCSKKEQLLSKSHLYEYNLKVLCSNNITFIRISE